MSQIIIDKADQAFVYGMAHALLIASIVMAVTAVVTLVILPARVRAYRQEGPAIRGTSNDKEP